MFDLKKACKNCKKASIQKYRRDIERLAELIGHDEIPKSGEWLKKELLFKKYKALPLNKRRAYSVAGVKALQAYGITFEKWNKAMFEDVKDYKVVRGKQKLSDSEKAKIPDGGFSALKKISTEFKRTIKRDISSEEVKGLYLYSQYIVIRFYSEFAFRNDLATVEIGKGDNKLVKSKGIYTIKMTDFKASDKLGNIDVTLSKALSNVLAKYIKYRAKFNLPHNFLLVNSTGGKLSKKGLGTILNQITKKFLGKGFGTRIIRILKARENSETIDKAKKIASDMLHSLEQSQQYNKK
jgi:hypothetical protein